MEMQTDNSLEVLRRRLNDSMPADDRGHHAAVVLAERLEQLKRRSPMFEAVSFSPQVEAMMAEHLATAAN